MPFDKKLQYVYQIGSDNQYRVHWKEGKWHYELLAGSVLFDHLTFTSEEELIEALGQHGMSADQFEPDHDKFGEQYSEAIRAKIKKLEEAGIQPCAKHGLSSKNMDNSCEACDNTDYPDDFKGTEG